MTAEKFREALEELGLTQVSAAHFLGVDALTCREWADPRGNGPPEPVARFLRYLIATAVTPDQVEGVLAREAKRKRRR